MAAKDSLHPEQFGLLPPSSDVDTAFYEDEVHPYKAQISPLGIRATQEHMDASRVQHYVKNGWRHPPLVLAHHDELHVMDGHHRIAAAIKQGKKKITMRVQETENY